MNHRFAALTVTLAFVFASLVVPSAIAADDAPAAEASPPVVSPPAAAPIAPHPTEATPAEVPEAAPPAEASPVAPPAEVPPVAPPAEVPPVAPPAAVPTATPGAAGQALPWSQLRVPEIPKLSTLKATLIPMLVKLGWAIVILIIGFLVGKLVGYVVRLLIDKTGLNRRLAKAMGDEAELPFEPAKAAGEIAFWLVMLFTLVAFFDALGLPAITAPLNALLETVFKFAPRLMGAAVIFVAALIVANLASWSLTAGLKATKVDEWLLSKAKVDEKKEGAHAKALGRLVYGLVFLLFLPALLDALQMQGLLKPVQSMVEKAVSILPNVLGGLIILFIGWFVAKIVRQITSNLLDASGLDAYAKRIGIGKAEGAQSLSALAGTLVYTLVMIPVIIAALNTLQITAISDPATHMLNLILSAVPSIFGAGLLLLVSYMVGRLVGDLVTSLLSGAGFDGFLENLGLKRRENGVSASQVAGHLVLVVVLLFACIEAADMVQFKVVADLLAQFVAFAGRVALAVLVFGAGLYLAGVASSVVRATAGAWSELLAGFARGAIVIFAAAMALRQTGIAEDIVNLTFAFVLGAVAVATALAFGIGCRDLAGKAMEDAVEKLKGARAKAGAE